MPRDQRLYMTFPNDFHRHPKLQRLTPEVRWTFVEMNGEARIADNDGRFTADEAEFMWPLDHLDALVRSHPTRPLVIREVNGGDYVIRDYAEHQQTRAERERLAEVSRENGRKGGRPRKPEGNLDETPQVYLGTQGEPSRTQTKAESESEDFYSRSKSQSLDTRARVSTDAIEVSAMTKRLAAQKGITSLRVVVDAIHRHTTVRVTADQAFQLSTHLLDKSKTWPDAPQRYVLRCIERNPAEVEKHLYEQIGVAS